MKYAPLASPAALIRAFVETQPMLFRIQVAWLSPYPAIPQSLAQCVLLLQLASPPRELPASLPDYF